MPVDTQILLENETVLLLPLQEDDFEALYQTASDPAIWQQHPNKDRYKRAIFEGYFEGAMQSKGAYKIIDKASGEVAGSTRFYDYDEAARSILIGYTFYGTRFWGKGLNPMVKHLMMDHIFQFVDKVIFHIGSQNIRSQIAITRLGATKAGEAKVTYYNETPNQNFIYEINKADYYHT